MEMARSLQCNMKAAPREHVTAPATSFLATPLLGAWLSFASRSFALEHHDNIAHRISSSNLRCRNNHHQTRGSVQRCPLPQSRDQWTSALPATARFFVSRVSRDQGQEMPTSTHRVRSLEEPGPWQGTSANCRVACPRVLWTEYRALWLWRRELDLLSCPKHRCSRSRCRRRLVADNLTGSCTRVKAALPPEAKAWVGGISSDSGICCRIRRGSGFEICFFTRSCITFANFD